MVSDMEVHRKQNRVTEFFHTEKMAPTGIHQHLLNIYRCEHSEMCVVCFSSGDGDSGSPPLVQIFTSTACRLLFIAGENA